MNKKHQTETINNKNGDLHTKNSSAFFSRKKYNKNEKNIYNIVSNAFIETKIKKSESIYLSKKQFFKNESDTNFSICLSAQSLDFNVKIRLDRILLGHLLREVISYDNFILLPNDLKLLILDEKIRNIISPIIITSESDIKLKILDNQQKKKSPIAFDFIARSDQADIGNVSLEFDSQITDNLGLIKQKKQTPDMNKTKTNTFPVFGRIFIDKFTIKKSDIYNLSTGDVLLTKNSIDQQIVTIHFSRNVILNAKTNGGKLAIFTRGSPKMQNPEQGEKILTENEKTKTDDNSNENTKAKNRIERKINRDDSTKKTENFDTIEIDDIDIELTFDLGNTEISLSDIPSIKPGYILEMPESYERNVYIRNSGRLIATGELVQVGENLGVEISEIKYGIS